MEGALGHHHIKPDAAKTEYAVLVSYLGTIWQAKGDLDKAVEYLEKALNPNFRI
jgi:tetratricopeptide (TPR) repeat protein